VIVSEVDGLLDAGDLIRDYSLQVGHMLPVGSRTGIWWKQGKSGAILQEYVQSVRPAVVHNLLSNEYRKALGPFASDRLHDAAKAYNYRGMGSSFNWHRRDDLCRLLSRHAR
jgi:cytoplasmic iron level regulating protein YaaA (DUF328/UPF0246 family)